MKKSFRSSKHAGKRSSMDRGGSERLFSHTAARVHPKNHMGSLMSPGVMRGGIRL